MPGNRLSVTYSLRFNNLNFHLSICTVFDFLYTGVFTYSAVAEFLNSDEVKDGIVTTNLKGYSGNSIKRCQTCTYDVLIITFDHNTKCT